MIRTAPQTLAQQIDIARRLSSRNLERRLCLIATVAGPENAYEIEAIYYELQED